MLTALPPDFFAGAGSNCHITDNSDLPICQAALRHIPATK